MPRLIAAPQTRVTQRVDVRRLDSAEAVAVEAARWLAARIQSAVAGRGTAHLALAGGSTPKRAYELLGQEAKLPWRAVHFYFGDERCVLPEDPDSNYRMARDSLTGAGNISADSIHRIRAELADRDAACVEYERLLPLTLDAMVLGIGEDGHTASLFPGSPALQETSRRVVAVPRQKPPPWGITVTPPVLASARELLVLAAGAGKADAVARALASHGDIMKTPSRLAVRAGATWLLDGAAAKGR